MIRPGLAVFRRDAHQLQFGTADDDCFVVEDRPGLLGLLRLLDGIREPATLACLARERVADLADDPEVLLAALHREGIIVDAACCDPAATGIDGEARSLLAQRLDAEEIGDRLVRRSQSCVEIRADRAVEPFASRVADCLRQSGIETTRAADTLATLTLVVGAGHSDRSTFARLRREQMPHLAVVAEGARVMVGPFVCPGMTPCIECLDLHRREWDPSWSAVLTQLGFPLAVARDADNLALATATSLMAAAVITHEIAGFCDETIPRTTSATITIGADVHHRDEAPTGFHPDCPCGRSGRATAELADPTQ